MEIKFTAANIKKIYKDPIRFVNVVWSLVRGLFYIIYYRVKNEKIRLQYPLFAYDKLRIFGPGYVQIGKGCAIYKNIYEGLTIMTKHDQSKVIIGSNSALGGLTIRCHNEVILGEMLITANALIQDELFWNSTIRKNLKIDGFQSKSVCVGRNVWIGSFAAILPGCRVEDDSVIAAGSLCYSVAIPKYSIAIGNPAIKFLPIEKILHLKTK